MSRLRWLNTEMLRNLPQHLDIEQFLQGYTRAGEVLDPGRPEARRATAQVILRKYRHIFAQPSPYAEGFRYRCEDEIMPHRQGQP